ncbi:coiled-coil domain-containing protein [Paraliobacillus sp. JSM ZJ581]
MNSKKVLAGITIIFGLMVAAPLNNDVTYADTQEELKEKRQELESIQAELIELNEDIERADEAINANKEKIKETELQIEKKEEEMEELEAGIADLEKNIEKRAEILKQRASALQKNGGSIQYLDVLFGSTSFSDFIDRFAIVSKITSADKTIIETYEADMKKVEKQKTELEEKLNELTDMQAELEVMQEETLGQKQQNEEKKEELETKEADSKAMINQLELEANELRQVGENAQAIVNSNNQKNIEKHSSQVQPVSGNASSIISVGYKYIGNSTYKFGGGRTSSDISRGLFDCSGYVSWAFRQGGVNIPASTSALSGVGKKISPSQMKPGDLVFFNTYKTNGHVGIYVGGNKFIGSQNSTGVAIANMGSGYWANTFNGHVRRVIN